jgi:hypothetical protein
MSLTASNPSSPNALPDEFSSPTSERVAWDVPEVAATLVDLRGLRAVCIGAAVIVGGSLVMTSMLGVIAITAGLVRGDTAEMIVAGLPQSFALALFVAIGGLLASAVGGYTATTKAGLAQHRHAAWAGILAIPLCIATSALLGDVGPGWLSAMSLAAIVPMAILGGHLASPREHVSFQRI